MISKNPFESLHPFDLVLIYSKLLFSFFVTSIVFTNIFCFSYSLLILPNSISSCVLYIFFFSNLILLDFSLLSIIIISFDLYLPFIIYIFILIALYFNFLCDSILLKDFNDSPDLDKFLIFSACYLLIYLKFLTA
jgi:hypothetical protein